MYILYVYMEKWSIHYAHPSHSSHLPRRYILYIDITNLTIHYTYISHPSHCLWFSKKVLDQSLRFHDILKVSRIFSIILESTLRFKNIISASGRFNKLKNQIYIYIPRLLSLFTNWTHICCLLFPSFVPPLCSPFSPISVAQKVHDLYRYL